MQVAGLDIHDGAVTNVLLERGEALEGSSEVPGTRIAGVELASGGAPMLTGGPVGPACLLEGATGVKLASAQERVPVPRRLFWDADGDSRTACMCVQRGCAWQHQA